MLTTPAVLDRLARELPDAPALITEDRTLSFAALRQEVRRAAAAMIPAGVGPRDRVAIWAPNTWQWVVAALATHYAGAVLVPLNTHLTAGEAGDILARSRVRLVVAGDRFPGGDPVAALDRAALPDLRRIVRTGDADWDGFTAGPAAPPGELDARAAAVRPDDVADILFTSGTTGRSKGVLCAHRQSLATSAAAAECRAMSSADRYLGVVPFFHNYGYKHAILGCLQTGTALVPQRAFAPEQSMRLVAEHSVTVLTGPPVMFQAILEHPRRGDYDLSSLRVVSSGGSGVSANMLERLRDELDVPVVGIGYGLTETNGYGTSSIVARDPAARTATCGPPVAGFELRVDDPDPDGVGEVLLRGPNVMLGYLDDPEATAAAIDPDGWLHTGDLGRLDPDGNLIITDRLTDMYISAGTNVYPAEVERVIAGIDGVTAAAVVGIPHRRLGETGRAFITTRPGTHLDRQTVIAHTRRHLADYKIPRSVVFLDDLPRNAGGKVLKTALRALEHPDDAAGITPQGLGGPPVGTVENWVADAWQVLLDIPRPGRRDAFTDLGGDSLAATEFSAMLHTQLGVTMSLDALAQRPTIAAVVAGLETGEPEQRQPVVTLRTDTTGPLCLLVPGIGGHAWKFLPLAQALTTACDLQALSLMDLSADPSPNAVRDRIRHAALDALAPQVPGGRPIVIGGYSFGAMIAADLACWLPDHGVPVARFILLDPDPLDSAAGGWESRTSHTSGQVLAFVPGSPAARRLDRDMTVLSEALQAAYLDGSIRLPSTPVSWIQSRAIAVKYPDAEAIFGTPAARIGKTVLEIGHFGIVEIPGVRGLARWLDGVLSGVRRPGHQSDGR